MPTLALSDTIDERLPLGYGGTFYGVHTARVVSVVDPDGQGRVRIALPWADDDGAPYQAWARLATTMAGDGRGTWFVPDPDDEVLVAFGGGDPSRPFVVGALWNGADAPPAQMDGRGSNDLKVIRSRNGVQITLDDTEGRERVVIETPGGQTVTLRDGPGTVELRDSSGNSVTMEGAGVTVRASAKVTVEASAVEVSAGSVTVNAGMSTFNGVVKADTVITNSVVSASYTPGAGNIW